jgi:hypothetical protein
MSKSKNQMIVKNTAMQALIKERVRVLKRQLVNNNKWVKESYKDVSRINKSIHEIKSKIIKIQQELKELK